ncbi:hypothetical protein [Haloarchaeobius sp. DT45]|uniref:hypothetical protein n=1 Tax=Haloarchaeobius sp. DT45 TaxID=3446116 RepID=UPI003F6BD7AB
MSCCLEPGAWEYRDENDDRIETLVVRAFFDGDLRFAERESAEGERSVAAIFTDPATGDWMETRVGSEGELVELRGPVSDDRVEATGRGVTASGTERRCRQTLSVDEDGVVRVTEEQASGDDSWSPSRRGRYVRVGDAPPAVDPTASRSAVAGTDPATLPPERQFDFWVGEWDVSTASGDPAGYNVIESTLGGALLVEHWESAGGGAGKSLNCYDAGADEWLQTWVDSTGGTIVTRGRFEDGAMRHSGTLTEADGTRNPYRGTWTPEADGTVVQVLETSDDDGETFDEWFHGTYVDATE